MLRPSSFLVVLLCAQVPGQELCDFRPTQTEIFLSTDLSQIMTSCGLRTVRGGLFVFRDLEIKEGQTVTGVGSNALIFIVTGNAVINGRLTVRGNDGASGSGLYPGSVGGGRGNAGGGRGGDGSPSTTSRSFIGAPGFSARNLIPIGGGGGLLGCADGCSRGSSGGGGTYATAGDPAYGVLSGISAAQVFGVGGFGCEARTLPGGRPGRPMFLDRRRDNNFFGVGVDLHNRRLVLGELPNLFGGQGGGGGGDYAPSCALFHPGFIDDLRGGGGGGGGGVVAIVAAGSIKIGEYGSIDANGGHGGSTTRIEGRSGGGGGGGSGGMVILASFTGVEMHAQGETFARGGSRFPVSADGGIGPAQGVFGSGAFISKRLPPISPGLFESLPAGGFGGMGIVEFILPPGNNSDGTNTIFDDRLHIVRNGQRLTGSEKQRFIAWQGWHDQVTGIWIDDSGVPTDIGAKEGIIRPAPILLPIF